MKHASEASGNLFHRARSLSLKWKIPLVIGLLVFVSVAVCYFEFLYWHSRQYERMTRMEAEVVIAMVQKAFEQKMVEGAAHDATGLLEALAALDSVHHIRIFDPSGNVWLSGRPEERGTRVSSIEMDSFNSGKALSIEAAPEHENRQVTIVTEQMPLKAQCKSCHDAQESAPGDLPITEDQAYYWKVVQDGQEIEIGGILSFGVFSSGLAEVTSLEADILARSFLIVSVVFAVSLPLVLGLLVTRRIVELARRMKTACNGNLAVRAPALPADEIGDLGASFNQLLQNLDEAYSQLEEVHRQQLYHMERLSTVGELAVRVAHEIKNPIAGIGLGVNLLGRRDLPGEQQEATLKEIHHQIQRLDRVTRNLLNFSRSQPIERRSINLCEAVEHTRRFIETEEGPDPFRVIVQCAKEPPILQGDAKLLEQALLNLVLNAKQAGAKTVWIKGHLASGAQLNALLDQSPHLQGQSPGSKGHVLSVIDDGPGIPEEQLKDIWKPFFTTKREGTGLGLSIVRQIVRDHGGDVLVESSPNTGSTFILVFPSQATEES